MNLFAQKSKSNNSSNVKEWTRKLLKLNDQVIVMVSELQCREEGCPPIETVIAVMETGKEKRMFKIHKPIDELTQNEVEELIKNGHKH
jgi:hypothetical protein